MEDCLRIIFTELQQDSASLYSCILVNRLWCHIAVPILWKHPYNYRKISRDKLYNVIIHLLPQSSKQLLFDNNIDLPSLSTFSNKSLFNYISFLSRIYHAFIERTIQTLIKKEVEFQVDYKKCLLEQEIYKLFIKNCNNIKKFSWETEKPLYQYPGASTCFSQLCSLEINLRFVTSSSLFGMAQICQNIEELNIHNCYGDIPGLINLIDIQKNLHSLLLFFKCVENQCIELSEVIERKSSTLKKFTIRPIITLLSPKFLPLINLQYLELNNDDGYEINGSKEWQEWKEYLSISSFPNLQYIETAFFPYYEDNNLIAKSQGNLLEIYISHAYEYIDPVFNKKLINAISKYCPKIENLTIDVDPKNLDGIKGIFLNCRQLKKVYFSTNNQNLVCDELLEIIVKFSLRTLCQFSYDDNWNFSVNVLHSFRKNWKGRVRHIIRADYFTESQYFNLASTT